MNDVFHGKGTYQKTNGQSSSGDWENGYLIKGRIVFMEGLLNNEEYNSVREELHLRLELLRKKYKDSDELNEFYINKYLEKNKSRN